MVIMVNQVRGIQINMKYTYWNKWATPILSCVNENHDTEGLVEEALMWGDNAELINGNLLTDRGVESRTGQMFKSGIYESTFDFFAEAKERGDCPKLCELKEWMENSFRSIFYSYFAEEGHYPCNSKDWFGERDIKFNDIEVDMRESWLHITGDGGYHGSHRHNMHSWGLIYYIDIADSTESNGNNLFHSDRDNMYTEFGNFFQSFEGVWSVAPENGKMLAFPANCLHSANVYRTESGIPRVVCAGNVRIYCDKW